MPHKTVAIVAAMRVELAPLLGKVRSQHVDGVELFEIDDAMVAIGGIGETHARVAAEAVTVSARPALLVSAGLAGAISPQLKIGDVGRIREVIDVDTGERYRTQGGEWVLATSPEVSDAAGKRQLLTRYGADVVDMEAAAVAKVAREKGLAFACVKSVSDEATFVMPPMMDFIDKDGKFDTGRFLIYMALHPKWWGTLEKIRLNSKVASVNLCSAVKHLTEEYCCSSRKENVPLG